MSQGMFKAYTIACIVDRIQGQYYKKTDIQKQWECFVNIITH